MVLRFKNSGDFGTKTASKLWKVCFLTCDKDGKYKNIENY